MRKIITLLFVLGLVLAVSAQKREYLDDKDEILRRAAAELATALQPDGALYKAVLKEGLIGVYDMQLGFSDRGDIRSVQVVERRGGDIPSQNRLRHLVHQIRFTGFKLPKGQQYRIAHTFDLDALHLNTNENQ